MRLRPSAPCAKGSLPGGPNCQGCGDCIESLNVSDGITFPWGSKRAPFAAPAGLVGPQCPQGAGEAQHQYGRDCYDDQVDGPRVAASADEIEMSGAASVSICVKVHSNGSLLHSEAHPNPPRCLMPVPCERNFRSATDSFVEVDQGGGAAPSTVYRRR